MLAKQLIIKLPKQPTKNRHYNSHACANSDHVDSTFRTSTTPIRFLECFYHVSVGEFF